MDLYSKIIFTVIAMSLAMIAGRGLLPGEAKAQLGSGCGAQMWSPCYVELGSGTLRVDATGSVVSVSNGYPIEVTVENRWPIDVRVTN